MKKIVIIISTIVLVFFAISCKSKVQKQKRPNILFAIADDATWRHFSSYGSKWVKTPAFDRVAEQGILFTKAYTSDAKCSPARSSLLTGRYSWELKEAANHYPCFPSEFTTFMEVLDGHNYFTGYTGKGWAPGNPGMRDGKVRELTGKQYNKFKIQAPSMGISNVDYVKNFQNFLNDKPQKQPFFFWYGGFEPHRPYQYGSGIKIGNKSMDEIDEVPEFFPDTDSVRTDMLDYSYEIEYFDTQLQAMLQLLEENGELSNTIVVVTSDNGMPFPRAKGQAYEYSNHIPLAFMWLDGIQKPGRISNEFVSLIDMAPTFLDVAGVLLEGEEMAPMSGSSLTDILQNDPNPINRNQVLIGKERHDVGRPHDYGYPIRGIVTGDYLYIHNFKTNRWPSGNPETGYLNVDGSPTKTAILNAHRENENDIQWQLSFGKRGQEELYNIQKDSYCINDLSSNSEYIDIKERLRTRLIKDLKIQGDPRILGDSLIFDSYPYCGPEADFYTRYMNGENIPTSWVNDTDYEKKTNQ